MPRFLLKTAGLLLLPLLARAQAPADTTATRAPADTIATPVVAAPPGGAASVPSPEFESYNLSGTGSRYTAALTGTYSSGTVQRTLFSTSHTASFAFGGGRFRLPLAGSFSYGQQAGVLKERELLGLTTPSYRRGRSKGYALAEASRSNLRAIDYRLVTGLGLGYDLYQDTLRNEVGLSYFLLYENTQYLTDLHRQVLRHSLRLKTELNRGPATFSALFYYQPAARTPTADYRLNATAAASLRLYRHLAFTLNYTYSFEKITVDGRSPQNTNLTAGLTYATGP